MRPARAPGCARTSGQLFKNRNSLPKFLDLVLSIPAFLTKPDNCFSDICHQIPPRVTSVGNCITKSPILSEFIAAENGLRRQITYHYISSDDTGRMIVAND